MGSNPTGSAIIMKPKQPPRDFFGNLIEIGDDYFYGSPTEVGKVVAIKGKAIVIDLMTKTFYRSTQMNCKSPEKGVCLNKIADLEGRYY